MLGTLRKSRGEVKGLEYLNGKGWDVGDWHGCLNWCLERW